jgi:phenylacetate-CoA ligase
MLKSALYWLIRRAARGRAVESRQRLVQCQSAAILNEAWRVKLLSFCQVHNPYYRRLLTGKSITPDSHSELPLLTKDLIKRHFDELKSEGLRIKTFLNSSGGSTGLPQTFVQDSEFANWSAATEAQYFREFHGIAPHRVRKVVLWGSERDTFKQRDLRAKLVNWLTNTVFLNSFNVTEQVWLGYVKTIDRCRPHFIRGYAGSLYEIARIINRRRLTVHRPRFVYSAAETLRDFMRQEIEAAFGAKVYDFYGSREVGPIAGECREGRRHIFVYNNHVEVVDPGGAPLPEGQVGRILITNLHNFSMPLIRYDIGDTGSLSTASCPCGSKLPHFVELKGRITDHFKLRDGTLVHGEYFTHLFYFRPWIKEFQVNQLAFDQVQVCVIKESEPVAADVLEIESKVRLVMGDDCRVTWEYVDVIPRTPQGKHLFTRNLLE